MKIVVNIGRFFLSVINMVLLIAIILNIGVILSTRVFKKDYASLLDYTYYIVKENNSTLGLNKNDLLLIDMRVILEKDDIVMYKSNNGYKLDRVIEIDKEVTLNNNEKVPKTDIVGKNIKCIKRVGSILAFILKPIALVLFIIILTVTTIIQNSLNKKVKKENPKPNFNQTI